jgi:hypothetical protein
MDVTKLSAKKLEAEGEKTDKAFWKVVDELIAAGRGLDKPSDIFPRTDPLSVKYTELFQKNADIGSEVARRIEHHGSLKPIK